MPSDTTGHALTGKSSEQHTPEQVEQEVFEQPIPLPLLARQAKTNPQLLTPRGVLQLQRTIGNRAVQRYLSSIHKISSPHKILQLTRIEEDNITIPLPSDLPLFDALVELVANHSAFRRRMIARSDDGTQIRSILRDHSNLPAIYHQIETFYRAGGNLGSVELHVRFQYEPIAGHNEERVDNIQFTLPGVTTTDFDDSDVDPVDGESTAGEFGLATSYSMTTFVTAAMGNLIPNWRSMTPDDRLVEALRITNLRLIEIGVPLVLPHTGAFPVGDAEFTSGTWGMGISRDNFLMDVTREQLIGLLQALYHEARHAEQVFLAIRYMLMEGVPGELQLQVAAGAYPSGVVTAARRANAAGGLTPEQQREARRWYEEDSPFHDHDATVAVRGELSAAAAELNAARTSGDAAQIQTALERFQRAHAAYRRLPSESDAWDVDESIGERFEDSVDSCSRTLM